MIQFNRQILKNMPQFDDWKKFGKSLWKLQDQCTTDEKWQIQVINLFIFPNILVLNSCQILAKLKSTLQNVGCTKVTWYIKS
jgi:hypothetical protein